MPLASSYATIYVHTVHVQLALQLPTHWSLICFLWLHIPNPLTQAQTSESNKRL